MSQTNDVLDRTPLPGSAAGEPGGKLAFNAYSCTNVHLTSAQGGSGLVYEAQSADYYGTSLASPARLVVKECYPIELAPYLERSGDALVLMDSVPAQAKEMFTFYLNRFEHAFAIHTALYQSPLREQVTVPSKTCFTNGTAYVAPANATSAYQAASAQTVASAAYAGAQNAQAAYNPQFSGVASYPSAPQEQLYMYPEAIYPMTQIPPAKRHLPGFAWFDYVRPLNKDDIFNWRPKKDGTQLKDSPPRRRRQ